MGRVWVASEGKVRTLEKYWGQFGGIEDDAGQA